MLKWLLICELIHLTASASDIILEPVTRGKTNAALIFIPGAELTPEQYVPLLKQVQSTSTQSLWVGIPSYLNNLPLEQLRPQVINEILRQLYRAGMPTNATVFLGGHSLGGITSQALAFKHVNQLAGQILIGSFLERKYRASNATYPVSTLTLSGELDGLTRVTRIIESFHFYAAYPHFTLVIPGMNHMDAASGQPSSHVLKNDIPSEINETIAHVQLALRMCDYIGMRLNNQTSTPMLEDNLKQTKLFAEPYLDALNLEGFYHFLPPCDNLANDRCQLGSTWSAFGQKIMSGLNDTFHLNITDEFHVVYKVPEHFAHLDNNCSMQPSTSQCTLNIHTVTQNIYDITDRFDSGGSPTSATEMRVKMISRQVLFQAADGQPHDFNQTDAHSLCGSINQYALDWALDRAASKSRARYESKGKHLVIGEDDGPLNAGPLWIWTALVRKSLRSFQLNDLFYVLLVKQFNPGQDSQGKPIVIVRSPTLRTPNNYPVSAVAGFHYCKLLSPARALEWIYIDSLKP